YAALPALGLRRAVIHHASASGVVGMRSEPGVVARPRSHIWRAATCSLCNFRAGVARTDQLASAANRGRQCILLLAGWIFWKYDRLARAAVPSLFRRPLRAAGISRRRVKRRSHPHQLAIFQLKRIP